MKYIQSLTIFLSDSSQDSVENNIFLTKVFRHYDLGPIPVESWSTNTISPNVKFAFMGKFPQSSDVSDASTMTKPTNPIGWPQPSTRLAQQHRLRRAEA